MSFTSGRFARQAQHVIEQEGRLSKKNTLLAYDNKGREFLEFCNAVFSHEAIPTTVTEEKLFGFLYYQSQRSSRKRGRKTSKTALFNLLEYNQVMSNDSGHSFENMNLKSVVGYDVINQCYSSILKIWQNQVDMGANNSSKEQLRSERVKRLLHMVQQRKKSSPEKNLRKSLNQNFYPTC